MIQNYGAKNFCCFKEWITISFELNANCPEHISRGKNFTNIICVKGANGSGKTNALKIISFLNEFCKNSFAYKPEAKIPVDSFFNSKEPTEIFVEFIINKTTYKYELVLNDSEVISETLYRKQKKYIIAFERKSNTLTRTINDFSELKVVKLRSNASIISTSNQYELHCMSDIYNFFEKIITNISFFGRRDEQFDLENLTEYYNNHKDLFDFTKKLIRCFDTGVSDIEIRSRKDEEGKEIYFPLFIFDVSGERKVLTFYHQSSGTKSLYCQLVQYKLVLDVGGVLVLDEFDINLHPHILPKLIDMFTDPKVNQFNAQLIFTTHNSEILDILGKYRTILINKEHNESYAYRLDEIPGDIIRNDRNLMPIYNSGKIGGVPKI